MLDTIVSNLRLLYPCGTERRHTTNEWLYNFMFNFWLQPLPLLEPFLATNGYLSYLYAFKVLKGRFLAGESQILKSESVWVYLYAIDIVQERWLEAEDIIAKSPDLSYSYAKFNKFRFEKAETAMKNSLFFKKLYVELLKELNIDPNLFLNK